MSKADKMFEELGYEKFDNHPDDENVSNNKWITQDCRVIQYTQTGTINGTFYTLFIRFHINGKVVEVGAGERPENSKQICRYRNPILNTQELQAINQKVKELRLE